jgi:hypothetical protein
MKIMQQCYKDKKRFEYILYNKICSIYKEKNLYENCFKNIMEVVAEMSLHYCEKTLKSNAFQCWELSVNWIGL